MIALGSDHGGYELKKHIEAYLDTKGLTYKDFGTHSLDSCDYPDFGRAAAQAVATGECDRGILVCTTGIGISITANKVPGIRCALCRDLLSAQLTRQHNNANMLALAGGFTGPFEAEHIVEAFLTTEFEGGRHARRVEKIEE